MRVANITRRTPTGRDVIGNTAEGAGCTVARVLAALVQTDQVIGAFGVGGALRSLAADERVAAVLRSTEAARLVRHVHTALCVLAARCVGARVYALAVHTCLLRRTFYVCSAANFEALSLSVSSHSFLADTERPMLLHPALGFSSANVRSNARVFARSIDASLLVRALVVN